MWSWRTNPSSLNIEGGVSPAQTSANATSLLEPSLKITFIHIGPKAWKLTLELDVQNIIMTCSTAGTQRDPATSEHVEKLLFLQAEITGCCGRRCNNRLSPLLLFLLVSWCTRDRFRETDRRGITPLLYPGEAASPSRRTFPLKAAQSSGDTPSFGTHSIRLLRLCTRWVSNDFTVVPSRVRFAWNYFCFFREKHYLCALWMMGR